MSPPAFIGGRTIAFHSVSLGLNHDSFQSTAHKKARALLCLGLRSRPHTKEMLTLWGLSKWVANSPHIRDTANTHGRVSDISQKTMYVKVLGTAIGL